MPIEEVDNTKLNEVVGGMKWTRGTDNPDVIDARGRQYSLPFGFEFTLDKSGHVSSWGTH